MSTVRQTPEAQEPREAPLAWYRELSQKGRRAVHGAFLGWGLDSYDYWVLPLSLSAIIATFGLSNAQGGWLGTVTILSSAAGGVVAGVVADKIGRVRTLMITVIAYALFTALCGLAPNYETLLILRGLQGFGFGGEWATGAILVAEYASARHRGRTVAVIQSAWAVGWGAAALMYTLVFSLFDQEDAWRVLFFTGALPALVVIYIRARVQDPPEYTERRDQAARGSLQAIFRRDLLGTTIFASLLSAGCQGGYYTIAVWLPAFLRRDRGLSVTGVGGYLAFFIVGAFLGYLTGGYLTDRLGRKNSFRIFAVLSGVLLLLYTQLPASMGGAVMYLGLPLGFCASAIFSGFGSYLAELYPLRARGAGQSFTYNTGRSIGAVLPVTIGYLADHFGTSGAMAFGALAYALAFLVLFWLPETRGNELS